jgi:hypothetical protein
MLNGTSVPATTRPIPAGSAFVPKPQYIEILRSVPNLKDCFRRLTIEEQMKMDRTFIPTDPRLTFSPVRRCHAFGVGSHRTPHQREKIVHVVQAAISTCHTIFRRKQAFYGNN